MTALWRRSLLFRRLAALGVLVLALSAVYIVAAVFPPQLPLPSAAAVDMGDEMRINGPVLKEGGAVLSYAGVPDETAEVWLDQATLTGSSQALLGAAVPQGPQAIVYTVADASKVAGEKQCETTIVVRRPQGAAVPKLLELMQSDSGAGDEPFRQIMVRAPGAALAVEVHTDAAVGGPERMGLCPRMLKVGNSQINWPVGPVYLLVKDGWINLRFNSANPNHPVFGSSEATMKSVSLGDERLAASGIDVVSSETEKTPDLRIEAHPRSGALTLHDLKLAPQQLQVQVGLKTEVADGFQNGKRFPQAKPQEVIGSNPALSSVVGALMAALIAWVVRVWFPGKAAEAAA